MSRIVGREEIRGNLTTQGLGQLNQWIVPTLVLEPWIGTWSPEATIGSCTFSDSSQQICIQVLTPVQEKLDLREQQSSTKLPSKKALTDICAATVSALRPAQIHHQR